MPCKIEIEHSSGMVLKLPVGEWLPPIEYYFFRELLMPDYFHSAESVVKTHKNFGGFSEEEKTVSANYLAHFYWGIYTAYLRFGNKYDKFETYFGYENEMPDTETGYFPTLGIYFIDTGWLQTCARGKIKDDNYRITTRGMREGLLADDWFETGGFHEAAHFKFYHERERAPKEGLKTGYWATDYRTDEKEMRALFWEAAFVRRYMPAYLPAYEDLIKRLRKAKRRDRNPLGHLINRYVL